MVINTSLGRIWVNFKYDHKTNTTTAMLGCASQGCDESCELGKFADNAYSEGESKCHPRDEWHRPIGRYYALLRATSSFPRNLQREILKGVAATGTKLRAA